MEIRSKRQVMVDELQAELKDAYFKPNKLTEIDSDPRWRTLDAIAEYKEINIEWQYEETDFTKIGGEPIVVEWTSSKKDKRTYSDTLNAVKRIAKGHEIMVYKTPTTNLIIVILAQ